MIQLLCKVIKVTSLSSEIKAKEFLKNYRLLKVWCGFQLKHVVLYFLDSFLLAPCINFSQSNEWSNFVSLLRLTGTLCKNCLEKHWVS